jgi:hypothetical protein
MSLIALLKYKKNFTKKNSISLEKIGISLGNVCYSAVYAYQHHYRTSKINGYNTCVFDLMGSNYRGIIKCIIEDFQNFTNPDFLILDPISGCIINTYYNFGFNHETPGHSELYLKEKWPEGTNHFINNNYLHFIERYNNRINNFKNYLNNTNNFITFIIQFKHEENSNDDCKELREAFAIKYPNLKYKIIII